MTYFHQRLSWTKNWLNVPEPHVAPTEDDFELVDAASSASSLHDIISLSDFGHPGSWVDVHGDLHHPGYDDQASQPSSQTHSNAYPSPRWSYYTPSVYTVFSYQLDSYVDLIHMPTTATANNYNVAGRDIENTFKDFRSASKARVRYRKASEKYYGWRYVKRGQKDALHLGPMPSWTNRNPFIEPKVVPLDKHQLYQEAQFWPRPPRYHFRPAYKDRYPWSGKFEKRMALNKKARWRAEMDYDEACLCYERHCELECLIDSADRLADWHAQWADEMMFEEDEGVRTELEHNDQSQENKILGMYLDVDDDADQLGDPGPTKRLVWHDDNHAPDEALE